jgi:2,3-bisphosphoglycerate-independent phosphoglycerate mutase
MQTKISSIKPTALIILDGVGLNPEESGNAVAQANAPFLKNLLEHSNKATLRTDGEFVGLPDGQMGNSEVGHLNLGAGRIVKQSLLKISEALRGNLVASSAELANFYKGLNDDTHLHLIGLVSVGGVHSHVDHLYQLILLLRKTTSAKIWLHLITDGRDTPPNSGENYLVNLETFVENESTNVAFATLSGRYYAMDRDNRLERTNAASSVIFGDTENTTSLTPSSYVLEQYRAAVTDEFIKPVCFTSYLNELNAALKLPKLLFWNFRADRMRQLSKQLIRQKSDESKGFNSENSLSFTEYDPEVPIPALFKNEDLINLLGEVVAAAGLKQLRAAETEKYPHVTYFFNGGKESILAGEERILVPSPRDVATYDLKPEMSAYELTSAVITKLKSDNFSLLVLNYANGDMVGHTGSLEAAIKAVETVSINLENLVGVLKELNWNILIVADHGNCEQMINYLDGSPLTAHTTFPVPVILANLASENVFKNTNFTASLSSGSLCDVAPTILTLMGLSIPKEMTGKSLIL